VLDAHNHRIDDLAVSLSLGKVVSTNLSPEDRCAIKNLKSMSIINFNFVSYVRAIDNGYIIAMSRLHPIDSLVET